MYWPVLLSACAACVGLNFLTRSSSSKSDDTTAAVVTPEFRSFQRSWLAVYLLAMFADWLQGPYVYALYASYGFSKSQIALLFVTGFASSMFIGTFVGALSDKYGRRAMCLLFAVLYALSAGSKVINSFPVLMLGRLCSGVATSLLFSAFEAWMVSEHNSRGFPPALLGDTFSKATQGNGIVAVLAGLVASFSADALGYTAPFLLALLPLLALFLLVVPWPENRGDATADVIGTMRAAVGVLQADPSIALLGAAQAVYEGAMYAFVFMWTPMLTAAYGEASDVKIPFGVVFASFMVCVMIGSALFGVITASKSVRIVPYILHGAAAAAMFGTAVFASHPVLVLISFLVFEATCGMFWPAYGTLRSQVVPEASRAGVSNVFRVPLNLLVLIILLGSDKLPPHSVFVICGGLHLLSLALYAAFDARSPAKKAAGSDAKSEGKASTGAKAKSSSKGKPAAKGSSKGKSPAKPKSSTKSSSKGKASAETVSKRR